MKKFSFQNRGQGLIGIIIALVIGVLIGGGAYYYLSRQIQKVPEIPQKPAEKATSTTKEISPLPEKTEETTNWKTYKNEKYGFEIKYPSEIWPYGKEGVKLEFFPVEKVENYIVVIQESSFAGMKNPYSPFPFYGGLGIRIIKSPEKDPVEKLKEEMKAKHLSEEYINETIQKVIVGENIPATKINLSNNKFTGYDFYIKKGNDIFVISFDNPGKSYYEDVFNQMLSTFKFLE